MLLTQEVVEEGKQGAAFHLEKNGDAQAGAASQGAEFRIKVHKNSTKSTTNERPAYKTGFALRREIPSGILLVVNPATHFAMCPACCCCPKHE